MKLAVGLAIILLGFISSVNCSSPLMVLCMDDDSSLAGNGLKEFKMNLEKALGSINHGKADGFINSSATNISGSGSLISMLTLNSSMINQSAENNTGPIEQERDSTMPTGIHLNNQGSVNGFWSMQSSRHGAGRSGINDRMVLSGDFNVQKSVSFGG